MSDFKIGDTVRCIETWTTHVVESGREYTVDDVYPPQGTILVNDQWVPVGYFEKVDRPFAAGDDVLVWAKVTDDHPGEFGLTAIRLHHDQDDVYAYPSHIVRPADGTTPPWVEEQKVQSEAISNITATLRREGGMDYDAAHSVAASLFRAGVRVEVTER